MQKIDIQVNKSKIYFVPLFNQVLDIKYFNLLKNTYFWYESFKEETFCLLYQFDGKIKGEHRNRHGFTIYENNVLFKHKLYRGYRDYGEYVIYEFDLTDDLIDYRNLLLQGKYSKLSDEAKNIIVSFVHSTWGPHDAAFIKKVLYRDMEIVMQISEELGVNPTSIKEVASIIDPERELFANYLI